MHPSSGTTASSPVNARRGNTAAAGAFCVCSCALFAWLAYELGQTFASRFESVEPGMSQDEVVRLIGDPTGTFEAIETDMPTLQGLVDVLGFGADRWVYDFEDAQGMRYLRYTVSFDADGLVASTNAYRWFRFVQPVEPD